jgi:hypothetical protein
MAAEPTAKAPRDFTYITPRRRRVSEYEAVNLYAQPSIDGGWDIDPGMLRSPEGRPAWRVESTRLRHPDWFDFRDPSQLWQRTFTKLQAEQERSIERATEDATAEGTFEDFDPVWLQEMARHYRVWSFVEWGLFRAVFSASRECLTDALSAAFTFEAFDRLRHAQDVVHYLLAIETALPSFSDTGAKEVWLTDPVYQPLRELVERLMHATDDWAEVAVVLNLVFDPIATETAVSRLIGRHAPLHGDGVTPAIVRTTERDRRRNRAWTEELVRMVTAAGISSASANREIVSGWIESWTPAVVAATEPLAAVHARFPQRSAEFGELLKAVLSAQPDLHIETEAGA